jgi:large subunit ribosomal protein L25
MPASESTSLTISSREPSGSRAARRLRRTGQVPGVLYGSDKEPLSFSVPARELRHALARAGAVLELELDGARTPAVLKELVRHPVNGEAVHVDLLRVRLDQAIQATVVLELTGAEDSPGVRDGGVLEQITRELTIEALPAEIPDTLTHDVSGMQVNDTITLESITAPRGVTLVDDPETVIATLTPPRLQVEADDEIEAETEVVGEGEAADAEASDAGEGDEASAGDADTTSE